MRAYAYAFFNFTLLRAVNGANTVKVTSFSVTEICVFFLRLRRVRTVHLGFINTENKGQVLCIVAHPFQQHFSKNKSEYD